MFCILTENILNTEIIVALVFRVSPNIILSLIISRVCLQNDGQDSLVSH